MQKLIERVVSQKVALGGWLLGFSAILMVRFFLEALSSKTSSGIIASDAPTLVHYYLFYLAFMLAFMLFLKYLVFKPEQNSLVPKVALMAFGIIFFAPIFDYLFSYLSNQSVSMAYIFEGSQSLWRSLLTFFGPSLKAGTTLGIRLEVAIILMAVFLLTYKIRGSFFSSVFASLFLYIMIFAFLSLPSLVAIIGHGAETGREALYFFVKSLVSITSLNNLHPSLNYASSVRMFELGFNFVMSKILFLLSLLLGLIWFYKSQARIFWAILKNSRPERVLHYMLMLLLGILLANKGFGLFLIFSWLDWLSLLILSLSFYFSWMFAVCINDIADLEIDRISNRDRPLANNSLSEKEVREAALLFLLYSLLGAYLSGFYAFFMLLAFSALYYIYSAPPTRFKTIPFFSSFLIGLCCLAVVLAGFFTFSVSKEVSAFPPKIAVGIVLIFFLWSHIRDMKDVAGDKAENIPTVPVIFGKYGPLAVAILSSLAYLLVPLFFGLWTAVPAIFGAMTNFYFVVKSPYQEKNVFRTYQLFTIALLILYFLL